MPIDALGWLASIILVATIAAQIIHQWRRRSSKGVSPWLFVGQFAASIGFTAYSAAIGNTVFVFTNATLALAAVAGLGVWVRHRRHGQPAAPGTGATR